MSLYALAVWAPVLFAAGLAAAGLGTRSRPVGVAVGLALVSAGLGLRCEGLALVAGPRAVLAEPSLGLVGIALLGAAHRLAGIPVAESRWALHGALGVLALALYPLALGLGWVDPYAWGYGPGLPLALAVGVAGLVWVPRARVVAGVGLAALAVHRAGWAESDNLWDVLIDPVAALLAGVGIVRAVLRGRGAREGGRRVQP